MPGTSRQQLSRWLRIPTLTLLLAASHTASAYYNNDRWLFTATDGLVVGFGRPVTLTWGLAADGTLVEDVLPGVDRTSNLIESLDAWYGDAGGGSDLTTRPWFGYLQSSFDRWSELSGITFVYEPHDDGAPHNDFDFQGEVGVRADIRLAGARYDGTNGSNRGVVGYSIAPDNGDVFLDTDDVGYFGDPAGNAFKMRHTLMHETGHSLGLGHLNSLNSYVLMEDFFQDQFDGPQIDDIRGVHFLYGDALEKNGGNDTAETATPLGSIDLGTTFSLGLDTEAGAFTVTPDMTDFVSIDASNDIDVFSFTVPASALVEAVLTPVGRTYAHQPEGGEFTPFFDSSSVGDLDLEVRFGEQSLGVGALTGAGEAETVAFDAAAGEYTLHVTGSTSETQLYRLDITVTELVIPGDYTGDGLVDAADYTLWRDTLGSTEALAADGDNSGEIDTGDYGVWSTNYGGPSVSTFTIPEPGGWPLVFAGISCAKAMARRRSAELR